MLVNNEHNKPLTIIEPKTIFFDLPEYVGNSLKHEIDFIRKQNKF